MPEPQVTGPSNTGPDPVVTLGPVASPVVRTGGQALIVFAIMRLITVLPSPDLEISDMDRDLISGVLMGAVAYVHNLVEALKGRRLVGTKK